MARKRKKAVEERQLNRWRLIEEFKRHLAEAFKEVALHPSWKDPQRLLEVADYLGLFLMGVFNPIVDSMRGLERASELERVQRQVCKRRVSRSSFSEAQNLMNPELLKHVYDSLRGEVTRRHIAAEPSAKDPWRGLQIVDSTLWHALPRMHWAIWRRQHVTQRAVRLHVKFQLADDMPAQISVTEGRACERKQWEELAEAGEFYVGDRYYGEDYQLLGRLLAKGCSFAVRLRGDANWVLEQELPVDEAGDKNNVLWQGWVRLGKAGKGPRVRVVRILSEEEQLLIATDLSEEQMSSDLVSLCYRQRWQVELFFRWLKHIMGTNHWMAESQNGVSLQIYLTLIAAQLLQLFSGQRPNKAAWELLQFMVMGWATPEEVITLLKRKLAKSKTNKKAA